MARTSRDTPAEYIPPPTTTKSKKTGASKKKRPHEDDDDSDLGHSDPPPQLKCHSFSPIYCILFIAYLLCHIYVPDLVLYVPN
ncbi:hypothetical protein VKT23_012873 [Stygiomarasmius scandens]|uniref:Transmembrane protein n=1 Tax=Marasmiellus scandens TaxID=2682957 RepID=A0ABR1J994_9AGAR